MPSATDGRETPVEAPRMPSRRTEGLSAGNGRGRHRKAPQDARTRRMRTPQGAWKALSASARLQRLCGRDLDAEMPPDAFPTGRASWLSCRSRTRPDALPAGSLCRRAYGRREMQFLTPRTASPHLHLALQELQRNAFRPRTERGGGW